MFRISAGFAFRARRWRGAPPGVEYRIDKLEDGALLGGGELGGALDALPEAGDHGTGRIAERREPEKLAVRHRHAIVLARLFPRASSRARIAVPPRNGIARPKHEKDDGLAA